MNLIYFLLNQKQLELNIISLPVASTEELQEHTSVTHNHNTRGLLSVSSVLNCLRTDASL